MKPVLSIALLGLAFALSVIPSPHAAAGVISGTSYLCKVQLLSPARSLFYGLGSKGAIRVEFWNKPGCQGGACGEGFFMTENATQIPTASLTAYTLTEQGILAQYQALVAIANAGQRVEWNKEGNMQRPLIYELRGVAPESTTSAFCSASNVINSIANF